MVAYVTRRTTVTVVSMEQREHGDRIAEPTRQYLLIEDVAAELHVSMSTLRKWRQRAVFPPARKLPNGRIAVSREELAAWFDELPEA